MNMMWINFFYLRENFQISKRIEKKWKKLDILKSILLMIKYMKK